MLAVSPGPVSDDGKKWPARLRMGIDANTGKFIDPVSGEPVVPVTASQKNSEPRSTFPLVGTNNQTPSGATHHDENAGGGLPSTLPASASEGGSRWIHRAPASDKATLTGVTALRSGVVFTVECDFLFCCLRFVLGGSAWFTSVLGGDSGFTADDNGNFCIHERSANDATYILGLVYREKMTLHPVKIDGANSTINKKAYYPFTSIDEVRHELVLVDVVFSVVLLIVF